MARARSAAGTSGITSRIPSLGGPVGTIPGTSLATSPSPASITASPSRSVLVKGDAAVVLVVIMVAVGSVAAEPSVSRKTGETVPALALAVAIVVVVVVVVVVMVVVTAAGWPAR